MTAIELVFIIAALQLADVASTLYFLKHTRLQEANPFLRKMFEKFGPAPVLLVVKGAFVALTWYYYKVLPAWMLWAAVALYAFVVAWNVYNIAKYKMSK